MAEGLTCYENDERLCEDPMCLRVGCRLRNERLNRENTSMTQRDEREKIIGAIEVWQKNRLTSFTPRDILHDFGDQIIAALRTPADGEAHAEIQRLQDAKRRAIAIADERAKENVELLAFIKQLSDALLTVRPLGGSELFVQRFDGHYADPVYCQALILQMRTDLHNAKVANIRAERQSADTTDEGPDPLGYAKGEKA